jgi:hypothetical protein
MVPVLLRKLHAAIELIEDLHYDYQRLNAAAWWAGNVWNAGVVLGAPIGLETA